MIKTASLLPLAAIAMLALPAPSIGSGFEYKGIRLGMTTTEFQELANENNWTITSYTTVDGRTLSQAIEYRGIPLLDSLTDMVILNIPDPRLGCVEGTTNCAEYDDINLLFRFGTLRSIEFLSLHGYSSELKKFSQAAAPYLEKAIGPGDKSLTDIETFFVTYSPEASKTGVDIEIARWARPEVRDGKPLPVTAVLSVFRAIEKYDYYDNKGEVMWPRGICRVKVSQCPNGVEEKWASVRKTYEDARAASEAQRH